MKKLKNVWLFLSFILMVAGMASCSTDDDPTGVEVSKIDIIGTWEVTANSWSDSEGDSGMTTNLPNYLCKVMVQRLSKVSNIAGHWIARKVY